MSNHIIYKDFSKGEKGFFIGLQVWIFLQLSRVVAIPLIGDVAAGTESPAWLYPAYLDLFAAVFGLPLMIALIYKRGLYTWTFTIIYLAVSIVDHFGNFVTVTAVGAPSIVPEGSNPILAPAMMTAFDSLFVVLLMMPSYRKLYFNTTESSSD